MRKVPITRINILLQLIISIIAIAIESVIIAYAEPSYNFEVIVLGSGGGPYENNLSSYIVSPAGENNYIAIDAGTLLHGLNIANLKGSFDYINSLKSTEVKPEIHLLQNYIKAYLITHPHLDHIAGLITASPYDTNKYIYGLPTTIDYISNNLFNWQIWPNFGNEGKKPKLNKYSYFKMSSGIDHSIKDSSMKVSAFPLSHSNNYLSTAFLIRSDSKYILYIGDTGPDIIENSNKLNKLWTYIAPLIMSKKLSAMFIECSFANDRPDNMLYGHLTPRWLMHELNRLSSIVNKDNESKNTLNGLPIIITHIKQETGSGLDSKSIIQNQLDKLNNLNLRFVFPEQGERLLF